MCASDALKQSSIYASIVALSQGKGVRRNAAFEVMQNSRKLKKTWAVEQGEMIGDRSRGATACRDTTRSALCTSAPLHLGIPAPPHLPSAPLHLCTFSPSAPHWALGVTREPSKHACQGRRGQQGATQPRRRLSAVLEDDRGPRWQREQHTQCRFDGSHGCVPRHRSKLEHDQVDRVR